MSVNEISKFIAILYATPIIKLRIVVKWINTITEYKQDQPIKMGSLCRTSEENLNQFIKAGYKQEI